MEYKGITVEKYPQSGFRLQWQGGGRQHVIYIDPFHLPEGQPLADLIFITHEHFDHCDYESVKRIWRGKGDNPTSLYSNKLAKAKLETEGYKGENWGELRPSYNFNIFGHWPERGIGVMCMPAYNIDKFSSPGVPFHPRENHGVGILITLPNFVKFFHAGDSDNIPEYAALASENIDIAALPVSGTYVMTVEEAVAAVDVIKPQIAIPMHYDAGISGDISQGTKFQASAGTKVVLG